MISILTPSLAKTPVSNELADPQIERGKVFRRKTCRTFVVMIRTFVVMIRIT